jgi:hypothetical protein
MAALLAADCDCLDGMHIAKSAKGNAPAAVAFQESGLVK